MDEEIDIVATDETGVNILFCDCEWQDKEMETGVLEKLVEKSEDVEWGIEKRKKHYAAVSRRGFSEEARLYAVERNILLFTLKEMISAVAPEKSKINNQ